jgi:hypothetical protein
VSDDQSIRDLWTAHSKLRDHVDAEIKEAKTHAAQNRIAMGEAIMDRFERLEQRVTRNNHAIFGNGKDGLVLIIDRLGARMLTVEQAAQSIPGHLQTLLNEVKKRNSEAPARDRGMLEFLTGTREGRKLLVVVLTSIVLAWTGGEVRQMVGGENAPATKPAATEPPPEPQRIQDPPRKRWQGRDAD